MGSCDCTTYELRVESYLISNKIYKNIFTEVPDYRTANSGWDEPLQDQQMETGWEKHMQSLGLPKSLYPDPAKKSKVKLEKIDHVEKYETEDETEDEEEKKTEYYIKRNNEGKIIDEYFIACGKIEGLRKRYNDEGNIDNECEYINGKIEGIYKEYDYTSNNYDEYIKDITHKKLYKQVYYINGEKEGEEKIVRYGRRGYEDYTQHHDPDRRKNFRARMQCDKPMDKNSPRWWACNKLW